MRLGSAVLAARDKNGVAAALRITQVLLLYAGFLPPAGAQNLPPQQFADLHTCKLDSGAVIEQCRMGYRIFGTLNAEKTNAVLFPLWFTGHTGDVGALIGPGPGHLLDTSKYFVIAVDPFGNGVSSSPSNSTAQHGTAFPVFTIRDMVRAEQRLLTGTLHLTHIHAVVGQDMGGMQAYEWAVSAPTFMDVVIPIVATPQPASNDLFVWSTERYALEHDPAYMRGQYKQNPPLPLVTYTHQMALSTPRFRLDHITREGFGQWFGRVGAELHLATDANDYLRQLQAMLAHDIAHGGDIFAAARLVRARMLVVVAEQDQMISPIPPLALARLTHSETLVLEGECGHMAPGCELATITEAVAKLLAQP